jgi:predicted permease
MILELLSRLASVFRRRTLDQDFNEEFATHIELLTEQKERGGLNRDEARRQAIMQLGGLNATRDLHREARGLPWFERVLEWLRVSGHDLAYAVRSLAKARAFTFVCVVSLGIGMGTVMAVMIVGRSFTAPPSGLNTEGLVEVLVRPQGKLLAETGEEYIEEFSYPDFAELRAADTGLTLTGWTLGQTIVGLPKGGTHRAETMYVSQNYFQTMGATLARGRGFDATINEDTSSQPVVIVTDEFWQEQLNSAPDIVGKTITLDRVPHLVVGIASYWFQGHMKVDNVSLWVPLEHHPRLGTDPGLRLNRDMDWVQIHGRLSPGVTIQRANAAVSGIMAGLAERYPATNALKAAAVEPYFPLGALRRSRALLEQTMMLGLGGMVLLIVCLNVSGMVLVRSAMRERELSIRQAVGAARRQLIRYLLCESLLLATVAGTLASAFLLGLPSLAAWWLWGGVPTELKAGTWTIAMCVALCLVTSLLFGLVPAIRFSRPALISAMKDDVGGGSRRVGLVHRLAASIQVGIAIPFLALSGVTLDHVRTTATADLGFEPKGLIAAPLNFAGASDTDERAASLLRTARANLAGTSGISSVGVADGLPLDRRSRWLRVAGEGPSARARVRPTRVDEGYFRTMKIRLTRGRSFTAADGAGAEPVAILAEPVATRLFPNGDALGKQITVTFEDNTSKVVTLVGLIDDLVGSQIQSRPAEMLLPLAQHPAPTVFLLARREDRTATLAALAPAFRNALRDVDPDFDTARIVTGEQLLRSNMQNNLVASAAAGAGGLVALTLSALGVYGVIGIMVAMRRREMAVRIALGATSRRVLGTIFVDVVKLVAPGIALGLVAAFALTKSGISSSFLQSDGGPRQSFTVVEPLVYVVAVAIAVCVSLLASLPSARAAASVNPVAAMRSE